MPASRGHSKTRYQADVTQGFLFFLQILGTQADITVEKDVERFVQDSVAKFGTDQRGCKLSSLLLYMVSCFIHYYYYYYYYYYNNSRSQ